MDFTKDYKGMTREERLADPDWQEMTVLERLAAIGLLRDVDNHIITLEEQYNQRFATPEQKNEWKNKFNCWFQKRKQRRTEVQKKYSQEIEDLTK